MCICRVDKGGRFLTFCNFASFWKYVLSSMWWRYPKLYCHQLLLVEKWKRLLAIYHWSRSGESIWQSWKWILVPKKGILESINQKLFSSSFAVWRRTFWKTVPLADFTSHLRQNATREIILAAWEMPKPQFSSIFLMVCITLILFTHIKNAILPYFVFASLISKYYCAAIFLKVKWLALRA